MTGLQIEFHFGTATQYHAKAIPMLFEPRLFLGGN